MNDARALFDRPVLLTSGHDPSAFASNEPALDDWLRHRALNNQLVAASRTYVTCRAGSPIVAGFFALSMGQIMAGDVVGSMRRNMPAAIPAVVLGRLAVDRTAQGAGLGRALLTDAVRRALLASQGVSARLVIVHAISAGAEAFYRHHGFTRLPIEQPMLALDLTKLSRLMPLP